MYCSWISSIVNFVVSNILILWHLSCDIQHIT